MWKKITSIKLIEKIKNLSKRKKILFSIGFFVLVVLIFLVIFLPKGTKKAENFTAQFVEDQVIVKYKTGFNDNLEFQNKLKDLGISSQEKVYETSNNPVLSRYYLLSLKKGTDVKGLINQLLEFEEIEVAEPNYIFTTQAIPSDPDYSLLWAFKKIDMQNAWNLGTGTSQTKIAVVDTGVDGSHPEFNGRVVLAADCLSGNCVSSSAVDNQYHGTHVAGTIGAAGNDSIGIPGINWNISIIAVRVMNSQGRGTTTAINSGIIYAVDNGAKAINLSLGSNSPCSATQQDVVNYALNKGASVIVAAGNSKTDASYFSPASCNGVIAVGATGPNDERAYYSNYGSVVDIAAPGGNSAATKTPANVILSTSPGGSYRLLQGTSMATPHVVGAAALLLSINPGLSPSQVKSCLVDNADPISTDRPIGKRLNVFKTLNACSGLTPIEPEPIGDNPLDPSNPSDPNLPSQNYYIDGKVYLDTNNNGKIDDGIDQGYSNVETSITGQQALKTQTNSSGYFKFNNLTAGEYNLSWLINGVNYPFSKVLSIGPSPSYPAITVRMLLSGTGPIVDTQTPTPTFTPTPTPTTAPIEGGKPTPTNTPTPTPMAFFDCRVDPNCTPDQESIHFCPLICTPK